jgi:hypothetical protein
VSALGHEIPYRKSIPGVFKPMEDTPFMKMMNYWYLRTLLIILGVIFMFVNCQGKPADNQQQAEKQRLRILLQDRKDRFDDYTTKLENKSGFFGNQTKKDIKQINEVLIEIVKTDNTIIHYLDALLDQTKFDSRKTDYDLNNVQEQKDKYLNAIDTLNKQLTILKDSSKSYQNGRNTYRFFTWFLFLLMLVILLYKRRKKTIEN